MKAWRHSHAVFRPDGGLQGERRELFVLYTVYLWSFSMRKTTLGGAFGQRMVESKESDSSHESNSARSSLTFVATQNGKS